MLNSHACISLTWLLLSGPQVYGTMYYKIGQVSNPASIGTVQNVMGVLFSGSNFLGNVNLMSCMPVFSMERVVS